MVRPTVAYFGELLKHMTAMEVTAVAATAIIIGISFLFFILTITRRIYKGHYYRVMDVLRARDLAAIQSYIYEKLPMVQYVNRFRARPGSRKWVAVEETLFSLVESESNRVVAYQLFDQLEYVDYYLKTLDSHKIITRAAAISKLGRMGCARAAQPLLSMLDTGNQEIIAVTVRAITKTGDAPVLLRLLDRLPELLKKDLISKKTIDSSFAAAGPRVMPTLLRFGKTCKDPAMIASVLGILSVLPPVNLEIYNLAVSHVGDPDPEVRAKAAKLIMTCEEELGILHEGALPPLLKDPVWFVRLQAVRSLGHRKRKEYAPEIASLVLDDKWQIRNEAAMGLTFLGRESLDAFLSLLKANDRYTVASVCEEMEKTDFVGLLLDLLSNHRDPDYSRAKEALTIMVSHGFSSPLKEFAETTGDPARAHEVRTIIAEAAGKRLERKT